jgi:hypothetical protein
LGVILNTRIVWTNAKSIKIRKKHGRIHTAFSAFDTLPGLRISDTFLSLFGSIINPLDKYCPDFLRRQIGATLERRGTMQRIQTV